MTQTSHQKIDSQALRRVLGAAPTGVALITTIKGGQPVGMVVGTFTSISLDPPLVGFFPGKQSTTWPEIAASGKFCVNVLSDAHEGVSKTFSGKGGDKFSEVVHRLSPAGLPVIEGASAWIDCNIQDVLEVGDHYLVVGAVESLGASDASPLIFLRGGYHTAQSLASRRAEDAA